MSPSTTLAPHLVSALPPSFYYISNFLTPAEEISILNKLPPNRWVTLSNRRLQPHPSRLTSTNTLLSPHPLPSYLTHPIIPRFHTLGLFPSTPTTAPNHCLVNEYLPGQGIMAHEDGDAYYPLTATVSLGSSTVLDVTEKTGTGPGGAKRSWRIYQERGSLLVTMDEAYECTLHGIGEVEVDVGLEEGSVANWGLLGEETRVRLVGDGGRSERGTRISLTYRDVRKVAKMGSKIFGKVKG